MFPKLDVYNQLYQNQHNHHAKVRNATKLMVGESNILKAINKFTNHDVIQDKMESVDREPARNEIENQGADDVNLLLGKAVGEPSEVTEEIAVSKEENQQT